MLLCLISPQPFSAHNLANSALTTFTFSAKFGSSVRVIISDHISSRSLFCLWIVSPRSFIALIKSSGVLLCKSLVPTCYVRYVKFVLYSLLYILFGIERKHMQVSYVSSLRDRLIALRNHAKAARISQCVYL